MKPILLLAITIMSFNASAMFCEGFIHHEGQNFAYDVDAWADLPSSPVLGSKVYIYDGNDFEISFELSIVKMSSKNDITHVTAIGETDELDGLKLTFLLNDKSENVTLEQLKIDYPEGIDYSLHAQGNLTCR